MIARRIIASLHETHNIILKSTRRLLKRGESLNVTEQRSQEVLETSKLFMFKTIPWYERAYIKLKETLCVCPRWWFPCFLDDTV